MFDLGADRMSVDMRWMGSFGTDRMGGVLGVGRMGVNVSCMRSLRMNGRRGVLGADRGARKHERDKSGKDKSLRSGHASILSALQ